MRIVRPLLVAIVAAALAAHVAYWYLPRERAAAIDPSSPAGELFTGGEQVVRAWFPYPHQNLGAAAEAMDDPTAAIAAAARLAGLGEIVLPKFGPFSLPPATALAIAVDPGGDRLAIAIEVFPVVAALARIAGGLADNAILRGGAATLSGRPVTVEWRGSAWIVTSEGAAAARSEAAHPEGEALAYLTLSQRLGVVEPGTYRMRHDGDDLVLASTDRASCSAASALLENLAADHDLALLAVRARSPEAKSLLLMPRMHESGLRLPDSASAWTADDQRWKLPGEKLLRALGIHPLPGRVGEWSVAALEQESLETATAVVPRLDEAMGVEHASFLLWVRPLDYLPLVSTISSVLSALPIAPRDEVRHWRDLEAVLEAVGPVDRVTVTVAPGGGEARLGWKR